MKKWNFSEIETKYWELWFNYIELLQEKKDLGESKGLMDFDTFDEDSFTAKRNKNKMERILKIEEQLKAVRKNIKEIEKQYKNKKKAPRLLQFKKKYSLTQTEVTILVILLMNELEDRGFSGKRGSSILSLLFPDKVERMKKIPLLSPEGKLIKNGFVICDSYKSSPLHGDYHLTDKALAELIGYDQKLFENEVLYSRTFEEEGMPAERLVNIFKPRFKLTDVIIQQEHQEMLLNILSQVGKEDVIFKKWGFGKVIQYGKGLVLLFYGPPGTGKTMLAEAVAHHLKRDLAVVRYEQVENCFVGVTEKNIVSIFDEISEKKCVLLFDEADALFSQRSQRDTKYDNRVVNILLTEIENYEGVVILTTNFEPVLDPALDRRVALKLKFTLPDRNMRKKIWDKMLPPQAPLAPDVDLNKLASYELTGAEIKNVVLNSARKAAGRIKGRKKKGVILMKDLLSSIDIVLKEKKKKTQIGFNKPVQ